MKKTLSILVSILFLSSMLVAQEHENHNESEHSEIEGKHKLSFYTGFTHVSAAFYKHETHEESTGKWIPTLGLDYYYKLCSKWSIGILADMELDNYMIRLENELEEERANVLVTNMVAKYNINHHLGVFAGPGVEFEFSESTKKFAVAKFGIEYEVEIAHGWELAPSLTYDWKEEYQTFAYGISFGKRF